MIQTWAGDWELVMLIWGSDGDGVTLSGVAMGVDKPTPASPAALVTRLPKGALILMRDPTAQFGFGLRRRADDEVSIRMSSPNLAVALLAMIHNTGTGEKRGVLRVDTTHESLMALVRDGDREEPSLFTPVPWSDVGCAPTRSAVTAWAARTALLLDFDVELKT